MFAFRVGWIEVGCAVYGRSPGSELTLAARVPAGRVRCTAAQRPGAGILDHMFA